jgi:uncharacterized membrane protein
MNTVFKFYLQAWVLFAVSSAAGLGWMLEEMLPAWRSQWRAVWEVALAVLVAGAFLFTVMGTQDKVTDRMAPETPLTLDGMAYMEFATQTEEGVAMDLSEDYRAIRWMQATVAGSPVIVEAKQGEYHWGTRYTIYTGLPGVVGWSWHQRQQRGPQAQEVDQRINAVGEFYTTIDPSLAQNFLRKYNVSYIIVGQLERIVYPGHGLDKFDVYAGQLWDEVYRDGQTVIYKTR